MPRQLLQSGKSPFLGSGTIIPFFHSVKTSLLCRTVLNSFVMCGMTVSAALAECDPYSVPAALPFLSLLTARATSVSVIASVFTSSVGILCVVFELMQYIWLYGQFSTAAKCSCHLFICCSYVVACLPSMSFIGGRFTCSPAIAPWLPGSVFCVSQRLLFCI